MRIYSAITLKLLVYPTLAVVVTTILYPNFATASSPQLGQNIHTERSTEQCGFYGNSDLYGLGIRLGVYFQWLSSLVTFVAKKDAHQNLWKSYNIFFIAIFIVLMLLTAEKQSTYSVEILILLYFYFGGYFIMIFGASSDQISNPDVSFLTWFLTVNLVSAALFFSCWFWTRGVNSGFLATPCGSFAFLFAKVKITRPAVTRAYSAFSVLTAIDMSMDNIICFHQLASWYMAKRSGEKVALKWDMAKIFSKIMPRKLQPVRDDMSEDEVEFMRSFMLKFNRWAFLFLKSLAFVWTILAVELTLVWNNISGVYSIRTVGQLIPFVMGSGGLLQILYEAAIQNRKPVTQPSTDPPSDDLGVV